MFVRLLENIGYAIGRLARHNPRLSIVLVRGIHRGVNTWWRGTRSENYTGDMCEKHRKHHFHLAQATLLESLEQYQLHCLRKPLVSREQNAISTRLSGVGLKGDS